MHSVRVWLYMGKFSREPLEAKADRGVKKDLREHLCPRAETRQTDQICWTPKDLVLAAWRVTTQGQ